MALITTKQRVNKHLLSVRHFIFFAFSCSCVSPLCLFVILLIINIIIIFFCWLFFFHVFVLFLRCVVFLCFVFHSRTARLRSPVHVGGGYFLFEFDDNKTKTHKKKNSKVENMIQQLCVFVPHPLAVLRTLISKSANFLFIFVDRENSQTIALVKRTRK